jgi:pentatricopeptide repeat protein
VFRAFRVKENPIIVLTKKRRIMSSSSATRSFLALLFLPMGSQLLLLQVSAFSSQLSSSWGVGRLSPRTIAPPPLQVASATPAQDEEFELEEFDEDDDFEFDLNDALAKKEEWEQELQRLARTSSQDPRAVAEAQKIFDQYFEAYVMSEDSTFWPHVGIYNLLIETHAYSKEEMGADEAERILSRMEDSSISTVARPNEETYLEVMDAWAMRKKPDKAEAIIQRAKEQYDAKPNEAVPVSIEFYNKLIKAYGLAGLTEKAEELFEELLDEESSDVPFRANYKSWVQIMKCFASQKEGPEKVQELFRRMLKEFRVGGNEEYRPRTNIYNVLIRSLAFKKGGAAEAEEMLYEMIDQYNNGDSEMLPNADTFRNVILAFKTRSDAGTAVKVEKLIQIQEGLQKTTGSEDLHLDGRSYSAALSVMSRSKDAKKASRAKRIMEKMENDRDVKPTGWNYYTLLSACAFTRGSAEENFEAFQIAVNTLKFMRASEEYQPDSGSYGMFLKACANLMPPSRKRDEVVENVFRKCCSVGLLTEFVLNEFEQAASEELQLEVLGGFLEDSVKLPDEWSVNVLEDIRHQR